MNPFYVLLILAGIAFTITACAFVVLMLRDAEPTRLSRNRPTGGLMGLLDAHGGKILAAEIALVAVTTVAAIGTERYWNPDDS